LTAAGVDIHLRSGSCPQPAGIRERRYRRGGPGGWAIAVLLLRDPSRDAAGGCYQPQTGPTSRSDTG
jgi:hypothetical protein